MRLFSLLAAATAVVASDLLGDMGTHLHHAVQAVHETAKKVPMRKHQVLENYKFQPKKLPEDFGRRYDEVTHNVWSQHLKMSGHVTA